MNRLASIKFGMALAALQRIKKAGASDDMLARAQFLEGVLGKPFNSLSGRNPTRAIAQMLTELYGDPTMDVKHSPWMKPNTGVYDTVVRGIDAMLRGKGGTGEEVLQESFVNGLSSGKGNFFYQAGTHFTPEAVKSDPEKALGDVAGRVVSYARKRGIDVIRSEKSRGKRQESWGASGMEADESELAFSSLADLEQTAMEDPNSAFGRGYAEWVHDTAIPAALTKHEGDAFRPFFDEVVKGTHISDTEYADSIGMSRPQFGAIKGKFKKWMEANFKRMSDTGQYPKFIADAQEALALANAFRRKAARKNIMARNITAAERDLRNKVIRLAHQRPELRPHLLPLLKQADAHPSAEQVAEEIMAGRPWGGPGYKPKAKDYDDPAPGPGSPPCTPDGEGGCYEHTDMYSGYGTANSGTNGSAARREYNKKYRKMMGL
jgi:hypothetical protein